MQISTNYTSIKYNYAQKYYFEVTCGLPHLPQELQSQYCNKQMDNILNFKLL